MLPDIVEPAASEALPNGRAYGGCARYFGSEMVTNCDTLPDEANKLVKV